MHAPMPVVLLGAAFALVTPSAARCAGSSLAAVPTTALAGAFVVAQYDGGSYGVPYVGGPLGPQNGGEPFGSGEGSEPYGYGPVGAGPRGYGQRVARSGGAGGTTSYRQFKIHFADAQAAAELPAVEHQIDIVDNAGLSASDMRLFRSRSIEVTGSGGSDSERGRSVVLGDLQTAQSKPVLLHEYLHILHRTTFPGGFNNPTIERFYREAVANNLFPQDSYMMRNRREYFAVTASCYLYGSVERPPYTREEIAQRQPDYYAYLGQLFGRARGSLAPHVLHAAKLATAG